jgi:hypothetical protein
MIGLTLALASVLVVAATIQLLIAIFFWRYFAGLKMIRLPADSDAKVAVMMCVRGCDPSLRGGLQRLLQQRFGRYDIHLVVDNQVDTAWKVAHEVKAEFDSQDRLQIHELVHRLPTCGLKCSSLIQGLDYLCPDTKYLLLTDSDVMTHPNWIADLVGPLEADAQLGLVCGTQWFEPPADSTWGALIRSSWNAGAMVLTIFFRNPWAGTIAMRVADLQNGHFSEVWRCSMVDDGPLSDLMNYLGKNIHFAPSLIMVNNENCTLGYAHSWVTRMLTWSRLYEPTFWIAVIHALFSNIVMLGLFLSLGLALASLHWQAASAAAVGLIFSGLLSVAAYLISRKVALHSCSLSDRELAPLTPIRLVKLFGTVPVAQLIYLIAAIRASLTRRVCWRGIYYQIRSRDQVQMLGYEPYRQSQVQANTSI